MPCEEDSSFCGPFPSDSNVSALFSSPAAREVPLLLGVGAVPKAAGTLDILGGTGEINLFMQVVLGDVLSLLVTKLSLYCLSLASFGLILPLPFHPSRRNLPSTCFFPLYVLDWFWVWSQSLLFTWMRNPGSTLHGWKGSPMLCQPW